jgi:hypothetical protein
MPIALLLILLLAPAAIADPPPTATPTVDPTDATTPAQDAAAEPDPPAKAEDEADDAASLEASDRPSRVYLIVDRHTELGGRLVGETADEIVIEHEGEEKAFPKARILSIIPLVEPAPGQNGVVRLRDGNTFRGIVLADDLDEVRMEIAGIETRFPRKSVLQVLLEESDLEKYLRLREVIPKVDHVRRLALCRWLHQRRMYTESLEELDRLLEDFDLGDARTLRAVVEAQLALEGPPSRSEPISPLGDPDEDGVARGTIPLKELLPQRLLTRDDVNLIRVLEIDFRRPPRISIEPETIRTLIQQYAAHPAIPATSEGRTRMFRADPIDLVRLMFELKARDLYPQINVDSEPYALNIFRQRVHDAWLIGNCATSRCHGGLEGGRFFLHSRNSRDERVRFTNLLILLRSEWPDEPLVDFERPLDSLVIQHALPRTEARFPHPDVPGWKPVFTNANQRLLADAVRWIESMYRPRPSYPVEYEPPVLEPEIGLPPSPTEPPGGPTR